MAIKELEGLVNSKNVLEDEAVLEEYSCDSSFALKRTPKCVVKPESAEDVQKIVRWANETGTPLVPVSSGSPHFRGDTVPGVGGAVIVDMSGMKKIVRVDRRNRVAMFEPGVTFGELIPRLAQEGLKLNMPLLPRSGKSVVASMLEREPVIMPLYQWDALDPMSCIEVIFGTGDKFRTGSAAGPGTLEEQWAAKQAQVNPMGPGQNDLGRVVQAAQGTMGVITWATNRCEAMPTLQQPYLVGSDKLEQLSDFIYRMLRLKYGDESFVLNKAALAAIMARDAKEYITLKNTLPKWLHFFCLSGGEYFPEERVEFQSEETIETAQQVGVLPKDSIAGVSAYELLKMVSKPSSDPYWKLRNKGACQDIFFLSTLDRMPKFVTLMHEVAEQNGYATADIATYIQPMVQGSSCHCEFTLFYDGTDAKETDRIKTLYDQAVQALMNAGAYFSRPYGAVAPMVYHRDAEMAAALKKVKGIFDPKNIMNPGKLCF